MRIFLVVRPSFWYKGLSHLSESRSDITVAALISVSQTQFICMYSSQNMTLLFATDRAPPIGKYFDPCQPLCAAEVDKKRYNFFFFMPPYL